MSSDRKITDAGVAGLPIHEGRAELLEEIMATAPLETRPPRSDDPLSPRRRWASALVAAAVVAVAAGTVWVDQQRGGEENGPDDVAVAPEDRALAVLDVDGWTLEDAEVDEHGGELEYVRVCSAGEEGCAAGSEVNVVWRPTDLYDDYVGSRGQVAEGPAQGRRLQVLGRDALLFAYSRDDHTVLVEAVGDFWVEVRGTGMGRSEFRELLARLTPVAPAELDAHLPEGFVTDDERAGVVAEMLDPLPVPQDFDASAVSTVEVTRYQLGVDVAGAVACAWVAQFVDAMRDGDDAAVDEAQAALGTVEEWPVLREMAAEGGYPDLVREVADAVVAGRFPRGYRQGLGCATDG
ncbi:hypothetical protein [Nocardioides sp. TF02-7]|uniref:hypothetical protein n=1 Tax=Nocardioides sp. TF02-7 TaxID=2917724 RepID=UPI001F05F845|nr:hypothetical protein [Nocardioides sp. TF02-7]UMG91000.1 hypothetical protein MF408_12200 [Nocardioides sp. TF02-7]